jgi:hypothetical protein
MFCINWFLKSHSTEFHETQAFQENCARCTVKASRSCYAACLRRY